MKIVSVGKAGDGVRVASPPFDPDQTTWVHAHCPKPEDVPAWLIEMLEACPLTLHDWTYRHARAGVELRGSTMAFLVTVPEMREEITYHYVLVFVSERTVVTLMRQSCPTLEALQDGWETEPDDLGRDVSGVLHAVLDAITDDFFPVLDALHDRAESLEENLYATRSLDPAAPLALKRELLILRKHVSPLRDVLNSILRFGAPLIPATRSAEFNDLLNHSLRIMESADLGREIVGSIMDAQLGLVSNRLNEVMRTMTVISTLLMVCSLIAGIYGMNFKFMPELNWTYGYPMALATMAVACAVVIWLFRRKKYI